MHRVLPVWDTLRADVLWCLENMCNKHVLLSDTLHLLTVLVCARILGWKLNSLLSLTFFTLQVFPCCLLFFPKLQLLFKGKWFDDIMINPLKPELIPICYLLALLGAHHFLHVSRIRVKLLTFRRLMSHIYGAPILDVSRSHTTTQHSR